MNHHCVSKPWFLIFKHQASRPLSDPARDSLEFQLAATIAQWHSIACEMADEKNMQRRSIEWSYLCKLVSRQGGEEGGWGSIRKNSGKFKCANSQWTQSSILYDIPKCKEENLLFVISGWWSVQQYLPLENWSLCQGPTKLWQVTFFSFT